MFSSAAHVCDEGGSLVNKYKCLNLFVVDMETVFIYSDKFIVDFFVSVTYLKFEPETMSEFNSWQ